jgi:hypothetical protein
VCTEPSAGLRWELPGLHGELARWGDPGRRAVRGACGHARRGCRVPHAIDDVVTRAALADSWCPSPPELHSNECAWPPPPLPPPPSASLSLLRLRGAGTHDGKRKKQKKAQARLAAREKQLEQQNAAGIRAKRAREKEAFRARMARRRRERELMERAEEESSEDDGAGLRYAMTLPEETRRKILDTLRALEPPLPDPDNPGNQVARLTDEELLAGIRPPRQTDAADVGANAGRPGAEDAQDGAASSSVAARSKPRAQRRRHGSAGDVGMDSEAVELDAERREKEKTKRRQDLLDAEEKKFRVPDAPTEEVGGELDIDAILSVGRAPLLLILVPSLHSPLPSPLVCLVSREERRAGGRAGG